MLNEGFILLHRSMLRWEWYGDGNTARLFIHLLLTVNYRPQHWRGLKIRRGQRVASVAKLAEELNMTPKCVRLALQRLAESGEIACEPHTRYTVYTVCNYGLYQGWWGKVEEGPQTAAPGHFPAMPQGAQGKLRANKGQQWNKEQQPFCPPPQSAAGYDGLSLEQLFCAQAPPGAQAAGRRARRRWRPKAPGQRPPQAEHEAARCGQTHDGTAAPQAEHRAAPRPAGGAAGASGPPREHAAAPPWPKEPPARAKPAAGQGGTAAPQAEHGAAPRPAGGAAGQQAARRPETQTEGTA